MRIGVARLIMSLCLVSRDAGAFAPRSLPSMTRGSVLSWTPSPRRTAAAPDLSPPFCLLSKVPPGFQFGLNIPVLFLLFASAEARPDFLLSSLLQ